MTEPTSTPDGGLREAVEALEASLRASGHLSGRFIADELRALLAAHSEPVPTPDSEGGRQCAGCGQRLRQMNPPWPRLWTCESKDCPGNLADRFHDYPTFAPDSEGVRVVVTTSEESAYLSLWDAISEVPRFAACDRYGEVIGDAVLAEDLDAAMEGHLAPDSAARDRADSIARGTS